ncbi:MAG: hypothetical protein BGN88_07320 [Clostridiales bacterium 43-6]|nr:MAG: hypothetical protein BGN88_07320 [Clostridiales bacterium 43-6]
MKGRIITRDYGKQLNHFLKGNRGMLLMAFLLLLGMLIGTLFIKNPNAYTTNYVSSLFGDFLSARRGQPFLNTLFISFFSVLPFLLALYISGLCALGMPACIFIPAFRGLGLGLTAGYLYATLSLKGIAFFALIIIPGAFISSIVLILAGRESLRFSSEMFKILLPSVRPNTLHEEFRRYSIKFLVLVLILFASSIMDALMSAAFFGFFSF